MAVAMTRRQWVWAVALLAVVAALPQLVPGRAASTFSHTVLVTTGVNCLLLGLVELVLRSVRGVAGAIAWAASSCHERGVA
ncbi:MAG: hypothetical protein JWO22_2024 [Frankiales bacterium]|nr:hypothetical protein [Frankiales bacterium]